MSYKIEKNAHIISTLLKPCYMQKYDDVKEKSSSEMSFCMIDPSI